MARLVQAVSPTHVQTRKISDHCSIVKALHTYAIKVDKEIADVALSKPDRLTKSESLL